MSNGIKVTPSDGRTGEKVAVKEKRVERLKELFNIWRKYAKIVLVSAFGIMILQWLLNRFAGPISVSLSRIHLPLIGTPQIREIGHGIMFVVRWLFWLSFVVWYTTHSLKIIQPFEQALITRIGTYNRTRKKGACFMFYPLESIEFVKVYDTRIDLSEQPVYTGEKIRVGANAILWFRIRNAAAAAYNVDDIKESIYDAAYTAIRNAAANQEIDKINAATGEIKTCVEESFKKVTETGMVIWPQKEEKDYKGRVERLWFKLKKLLTFDSQDGREENWGIDLRKVEIQDFTLPPDYEEQQRKIRVAELQIKEAENRKLAKFQDADAVEYTFQKEGSGRKALIKEQVEALGENGAQLYIADLVAGKVAQNTKWIGVPSGTLLNKLFSLFLQGGNRQPTDGE
jgi:regulator of protease activity HflC (stomatin/prohibitin superfamily)